MKNENDQWNRPPDQFHFRLAILVIQCDGNAMRAVRFIPHIADHGHAGGAENLTGGLECCAESAVQSAVHVS